MLPSFQAIPRTRCNPTDDTLIQHNSQIISYS